MNVYSKPISFNKGINRFIWPLELERNKDELNRYKEKFIELVNYLKDIVTDRKILSSLDFSKTKSFNEINKLRKILLDNYGMYAGGKKIFGDKVYKKFDAPVGNYKIYIELDNGEIYTDIINIREDPIKSN